MCGDPREVRNSIRAGFAGREWLDSQGGRFTFQTKSGSGGRRLS